MTTPRTSGFAISIDGAKDTINKAIASPLAPTGYLGITTTDLTPAVAQQLGTTAQSGAYVISTNKGEPADKAGMKSGDVIVSLDGKTVSDENDLASILNGLQPGTTVPVVVDRGGQQVTLNVTLAARPLPSQLP